MVFCVYYLKLRELVFGLGYAKNVNLLPRPRPRGSEGFSRSASPSPLVKLLASITKLTKLSFQHLLVVGVQHQPRHAAGRGVLACSNPWLPTGHVDYHYARKNSLLKKYGYFI